MSVPMECSRSTQSSLLAGSVVMVAGGGTIFFMNSPIICGLSMKLK